MGVIQNIKHTGLSPSCNTGTGAQLTRMSTGLLPMVLWVFLKISPEMPLCS